MVDRECWRPTTVHSGVMSDIIGRMVKFPSHCCGVVALCLWREIK